MSLCSHGPERDCGHTGNYFNILWAMPGVALSGQGAKGDIHAQLSLAYRFRDGKGVQKDYAEAMRWAHVAADRGNREAMDFVGWMFYDGQTEVLVTELTDLQRKLLKLLGIPSNDYGC
jgi:TPR repeat protein